MYNCEWTVLNERDFLLPGWPCSHVHVDIFTASHIYNERKSFWNSKCIPPCHCFRKCLNISDCLSSGYNNTESFSIGKCVSPGHPFRKCFNFGQYIASSYRDINSFILIYRYFNTYNDALNNSYNDSFS